jgi:hypothetical protein
VELDISTNCALSTTAIPKDPSDPIPVQLSIIIFARDMFFFI